MSRKVYLNHPPAIWFVFGARMKDMFRYIAMATSHVNQRNGGFGQRQPGALPFTKLDPGDVKSISVNVIDPFQ